MIGIAKSALSLIALIVSARLTIDLGLDVPISMQSLAVCLIAYFDRYGVYVVLSYLLLGGLGLPVFADGAGGWKVLTGSSFGYLIGFMLAAVHIRWSRLDQADSTSLLQGLTLATVIILAGGFTWLTITKSANIAWVYGVLPYLFGAAVKVLLAFVAILLYRRIVSTRA